MTRYTRIVSIIGLLSFTCLRLTAQVNELDTAKLPGKWVVYSVTGSEYSRELIKKALWKIDRDGKYTLVITYSNHKQEVLTGSWSLSDSTIMVPGDSSIFIRGRYRYRYVGHNSIIDLESCEYCESFVNSGRIIDITDCCLRISLPYVSPQELTFHRKKHLFGKRMKKSKALDHERE